MLEEGDEILIKGTISKIPEEGRSLYRIKRDDGTILWADKSQMYVRYKGQIVRADFVKGLKSEDDDKRNEIEKFFRGE